MVKILKIIPAGWECTIEECPPGHFVCDGQLCFKTEYGCADSPDFPMQVFNSAGENFVARKIMVQPVDYEWGEEDML